MASSSSATKPSSNPSEASSLPWSKTKRSVTIVVILAVLFQILLSSPTFLHSIDKILDYFQQQLELRNHLATNIYLNNNYAPVSLEHINVTVDIVEGSLPLDFDGLALRIGPNEIPSHLSKLYHWFDGHGMIHALRMKDGKATYSNKFLPTPRYEYERRLGESYFLRFGELRGVVGLIKAIFMYQNLRKAARVSEHHDGQANTAMIMFRDKFYALHEGSLPFEVALRDDGDFDAAGYATFENVLDYPVSAHPKLDSHTGNLVFHGYSGDPKCLERDGPQKIGEVSAETGKVMYYYSPNPGHEARLAHDNAITKNWIIVIEPAVKFDFTKLIEGSVTVWDHSQNLTIGLAPRKVGATADDVIWFDIGTNNQIMHTMNAWEEDDGTVVLWTPMTDYLDLQLDKGLETKYYMVELRMNPNTKTFAKTIIDRQYSTEFPRVREDCYGRKCRYGHAGIMDTKLGGEGLFRGFVVYDMEHKKVHNVVHYDEGEIGGEPINIPKTNDEDEMYVGVYTYKAEQSYFLLYDIQSTTPLA